MPIRAASGQGTEMAERGKCLLLMLGGTTFLTIGLVAIVVPLVPTTPFLLLAAACYLRGSPRMYRRMMGNRLLGEYLRRYSQGEGISRTSKASTITVLWAGMSLSALLVRPEWWVVLLLVAIGAAITVHIITLPTYRRSGR